MRTGVWFPVIAMTGPEQRTLLQRLERPQGCETNVSVMGFLFDSSGRRGGCLGFLKRCVVQAAGANKNPAIPSRGSRYRTLPLLSFGAFDGNPAVHPADKVLPFQIDRDMGQHGGS